MRAAQKAAFIRASDLSQESRSNNIRFAQIAKARETSKPLTLSVKGKPRSRPQSAAVVSSKKESDTLLQGGQMMLKVILPNGRHIFVPGAKSDSVQEFLARTVKEIEKRRIDVSWDYLTVGAMEMTIGNLGAYDVRFDSNLYLREREEEIDAGCDLPPFNIAYGAAKSYLEEQEQRKEEEELQRKKDARVQKKLERIREEARKAAEIIASMDEKAELSKAEEKVRQKKKKKGRRVSSSGAPAPNRVSSEVSNDSIDIATSETASVDGEAKAKQQAEGGEEPVLPAVEEDPAMPNELEEETPPTPVTPKPGQEGAPGTPDRPRTANAKMEGGNRGRGRLSVVTDSAGNPMVRPSTAGHVGAIREMRRPYLSQLPKPPVIYQIHPECGTVFGGTRIEVKTSHLGMWDRRTNVEVYMNNMPCEEVRIASNTSVHAITPAAPRGTGSGGGWADVTLIVGKSRCKADRRFYYDAPVLRRVTPSSGPKRGGNTVILEGISLGDKHASNLLVRIGDQLARDVEVLVPGRRIQCVAPAFVPNETNNTLFPVQIQFNHPTCGILRSAIDEMCTYSYTELNKKRGERPRKVKVPYVPHIELEDITDVFVGLDRATARNEVSTIKSIFQDHRIDLGNIYLHYAMKRGLAEDEVDNNWMVLDYSMFSRFLHDSYLLGTKMGPILSEADAGKLFHRVNREQEEDNDNPDLGLLFREFLAAIIRVAHKKYSNITLLSEAVQYVVEEHIVVFARNIPDQKPFLTMFAKPDIQAMYQKYEQDTRHAYIQFQGTDGSFHWNNLLGLLDTFSLWTGPSGNKVTLAGVRDAFVSCHFGLWVPKETHLISCLCEGLCSCESSTNQKIAPYMDMSFGRFEELIARLGMVSMGVEISEVGYLSMPLVEVVESYLKRIHDHLKAERKKRELDHKIARYSKDESTVIPTEVPTTPEEVDKMSKALDSLFSKQPQTAKKAIESEHDAAERIQTLIRARLARRAYKKSIMRKRRATITKEAMAAPVDDGATQTADPSADPDGRRIIAAVTTTL